MSGFWKLEEKYGLYSNVFRESGVFMEMKFKTSKIMKTATLFLPILLISLLSSCKQNDENFGSQNLLIGTWIYEKNESLNNNNTDFIAIYVRRSKFENNDTGISFFKSNELIQRSYYGWCGTPPIPIAESKGFWKLDGKELIIKSELQAFKGGNTNPESKSEIIEINSTTLKLKYNQ